MISKSYEEWRRIHTRAARDYINSEWTRGKLIGVAKKRKKLFSQATGSMLDVGCGSGNNFPYLIKATHMTGIDFSPVMLEKARKSARLVSVPIHLREGGTEELDFPDNPFDTVISSLYLFFL
jgi:ubiquinone/menaquinone biosynthesis C-methylase UbiE